MRMPETSRLTVSTGVSSVLTNCDVKKSNNSPALQMRGYPPE
jgi:hypothetical protein